MFRNPYSFSFRHALQIHSDIPRKTPDSACTRLAEKVRIKKEGQSPSKWRRERDSNSRKACAFDGFQDRCNQPLCHLSNNFSTYLSELRSDDGLRLNRGARRALLADLRSDAKTVAINRSAISPIIFQHTFRNSVPTTVCGSTAAPDAPCSPIFAPMPKPLQSTALPSLQ